MIIDAIEATPVAIPATRTCAWSLGRSYGHTRTIVAVRTRDGAVGYGEAPTDKAAPLVGGVFAERLRGVSAHEVTTARIRCLGSHRDFGYLADPLAALAFAAIEIALWDLKGKAAVLPLYRLLGGAARPKAPFGACAYTVALEEGHAPADVPRIMAEIGRTAIARTGARLLEFKVGRHGPDCDAATVRAVRDAVGPDVELAVDANMAMSMSDARRFLDRAREAGLAWIEEPVASLAGMQRLRADFGVPVSTHCTDLEKLQGFPPIDGIVGDINVDGGVSGVARVAATVAATGRRFWLRSNGETGIGFAAICHLGMALPELDRLAQSLLNWCEDDLVEGEPWSTRDGGVVPPERPGLGVEIDTEALRHYAERYRREGPFSRYDAP